MIKINWGEEFENRVREISLTKKIDWGDEFLLKVKKINNEKEKDDRKEFINEIMRNIENNGNGKKKEKIHKKRKEEKHRAIDDLRIVEQDYELYLMENCSLVAEDYISIARQIRCLDKDRNLLGVLDGLLQNKKNPSDYLFLEFKNRDKKMTDDQFIGQLSRFIGSTILEKEKKIIIKLTNKIKRKGILICSNTNPKLEAAIKGNPNTTRFEYNNIFGIDFLVRAHKMCRIMEDIEEDVENMEKGTEKEKIKKSINIQKFFSNN